MGASISIYLDTRIKKADNVYPVKLRATYNRERLYLGIDKARINSKLEGSQLDKFRFDGKGNYSIDHDSFNKAMEAKKAGIFKELQAVFKGIELDAQRKADNLEPFTLDRFKSMMSKIRSKKNQVFAQFDELITELKEADRIGTAISYRCASISLKKFTDDKEVPFEYFTKEKLERYRSAMQSGEKPASDTTIGMYLRALRVLYNRANDEEITNFNPFGKGKDKFKIPKGNGRKIALNMAELQKIFEFELPEKHPYSFYLDAWKLIYLLGGLNPTDLCLLRESNIQNGFVFFKRQKTKRTSIDQKTIHAPYSESVKKIVAKWQVVDRKDPFLIPVLLTSTDATQQKATIAQFVKMINTTMKHVAEALNINQKITSYVARHSIATQLLRSGASVKLIGDQLGHHNTKTTEAYLDGFEDEQIREAFNNATKF
ncbi:MAG: site-specific integrase [Prolixibacteraceae bacterium]|jgi:integrase|nr:site-specific integrase [Prolixibacteraceae bacterium]